MLSPLGRFVGIERNYSHVIMPYSRSTESNIATLPTVLAIREIAEDLEKKAIGRDVIGKEIANRQRNRLSDSSPEAI